jgi:tetratricopeptide (TPR) repeat protein
MALEEIENALREIEPVFTGTRASAEQRIVAAVAVDEPEGDPVLSSKYLECFSDLFGSDELRPAILLEVAVAMARRRLAAARETDQRGLALTLLADALAKLASVENFAAAVKQAVKNNSDLEDRKVRQARFWERRFRTIKWESAQGRVELELLYPTRSEFAASLDVAVKAYRTALEDASVPVDAALAPAEPGGGLCPELVREALRTNIAALAERKAAEQREFDLEESDFEDWKARAARARKSETARLGEAVTAYREALKEWSRERFPHQWARTQMHLGDALCALGALEDGTERIEQAVEAYSSALEGFMPERDALDCCTAFGKHGIAVLMLAERWHNPDLGRHGLGRDRERASRNRTCLYRHPRGSAGTFHQLFRFGIAQSAPVGRKVGQERTATRLGKTLVLLIGVAQRRAEILCARPG